MSEGDYRTVAYHLRGRRSDVVEVSVRDGVLELRSIHVLARLLRPRLRRPIDAIVAVRETAPSHLVGFPLGGTNAIEVCFADGTSAKLQGKGVNDLRDRLVPDQPD